MISRLVYLNFSIRIQFALLMEVRSEKFLLDLNSLESKMAHNAEYVYNKASRSFSNSVKKALFVIKSLTSFIFCQPVDFLRLPALGS